MGQELTEFQKCLDFAIIRRSSWIMKIENHESVQVLKNIIEEKKTFFQLLLGAPHKMAI